MIRSAFCFALLLLTGFGSWAQEEEAQDTTQVVEVTADTLKIEEPKRVQNPLAPSKAAFYSAVLPGLGQIYNKSYWKLPILYGGLAATIYFYIDNNNELNRFRDAFKLRQAGFEDEFLGLLDERALQDAQDTFRRNRDLSALLTVAVYVLNIIDANVDAHLKQYNINDDLSFRLKPYINNNLFTNQVNYGLSLNLDF